MKAKSKREKRIIRLVAAFGLVIVGTALLYGLRAQRMRTHLDRALRHPSWMTRLDGTQKYTFWRTGSDPGILDDGERAPIERERRSRLIQVIYFLEGGHLTLASEGGRWIVAATLDDSYDHQNIMLAARAIRMFAPLEKEQGIPIGSSESVFSTILYKGLISWAYSGSWCSKAANMHWARSKGNIGRAYQETRDELRALSQALSRFGPEATEMVEKRLKNAGGGITDESAQLKFVLKLLDGTYARYSEN